MELFETGILDSEQERAGSRKVKSRFIGRIARGADPVPKKKRQCGGERCLQGISKIWNVGGCGFPPPPIKEAADARPARRAASTRISFPLPPEVDPALRASAQRAAFRLLFCLSHTITYGNYPIAAVHPGPRRVLCVPHSFGNERYFLGADEKGGTCN